MFQCRTIQIQQSRKSTGKLKEKSKAIYQSFRSREIFIGQGFAESVT